MPAHASPAPPLNGAAGAAAPSPRLRAGSISARGLSVATPAALLPTQRGQLPHVPRALLPAVPGGVLALSVPASDFLLLNARTGLCGGALAAAHAGGSLAALAALPPALTFLTVRAPGALPPAARARDVAVLVDARAARLPLTAPAVAKLHARLRTDFAEAPSGACADPAAFAAASAAQAAAAADPRTLFGAARADGDAPGAAAGAFGALGFAGVSVAGLFAGECADARVDAVAAAAAGAGGRMVAVLGGDGEPGEVLRLVGAGADLLEAGFAFERAAAGEAVDFARGAVLVLRDKHFARDRGPLVEGCVCRVCAGYARAYVHHLLDVHEMLAPTLLAVHNMHAYLQWFAQIRRAVRAGPDKFREFADAFFARRATLRAGGAPRGLRPL